MKKLADRKGVQAGRQQGGHGTRFIVVRITRSCLDVEAFHVSKSLGLSLSRMKLKSGRSMVTAEYAHSRHQMSRPHIERNRGTQSEPRYGVTSSYPLSVVLIHVLLRCDVTMTFTRPGGGCLMEDPD